MQNHVDTQTSVNLDPLIVIPCLNEVAHIGRLLRQLIPSVQKLNGRIVVVDGGSVDGTQDVVRQFAGREPRVALLQNPDRIQSAAVNLAVAQDNGRAMHLIRIDAHCDYPDDYCERLMQMAQSVHADSIVVSMIAEGRAPVQRLNAATQNASVGNGGSAHRMAPCGAYVDHGHHALIKIDAFRAIGGYDPTFSHNEDAEFDYRLRQSGYRIWLASEPVITYFPRPNLSAVARQYFNYGRGRARNLLKHSVLPQMRQAKVILLLPAVLIAVLLGPLHWAFALPAMVWLVYCLRAGLIMAWEKRDPVLALCGLVAMIMHLSWSVGFWQNMVGDALATSRKTAR